jgi:hypothetical protein
LAQDEEDFFYQPQRGQGQRLDPAISRIALAAGGVTILIIGAAFAWSGFHAGSFGPPPIINPPDLPLRVAPASPGGLVVPGADVPIMSGQADSNAAPQLAPQGQMPEIAQLDQAAGLNQPPPPVAAPAPPAAVAAVPASAIPAAGTPSPAALAAAAAAPATLAALPKTGPAQVQLAATPDEGGAEAAWDAARRQAPDLLAGKNAIILPAVISGASVWRVRLAGFASVADAQALCAQLTAKGVGCTVPGS